MNKKIVIGAILLVPVVLHVIYWLVVSPAASYYLTVDEYAPRAASAAAVRVGGAVVPGSIRWDNATRTLNFQLAGERATLNVVYRGIAPDAFRDGVTAVLDGMRAADGSFIATNVLVKCPHQYLPAARLTPRTVLA